MFHIDVLKVRYLMKAQKMTAADLAEKVSPAIVEDIQAGTNLKIRDFDVLKDLGQALKISPFSLILNQLAF